MNLDGLIALRSSISNGALDADALPRELKLLSWGDNPSTKGNIRVGKTTLSTLPGNQARMQFDKIGIDYEHQSVEGHRNFREAPREYAAYGTPDVREGDGLYLTALDWTPSGKKNARNYCDLSPVVIRQDGEVVFVHSVALCPQGAVEGLEFFSADAPPVAALAQTLSVTNMNPELLDIITSLFGTATDADEETLLAAAREYIAQLAAAKSEPTPSGKDADALTALTARVNALATALDAQGRETLLAAAAQAGKLVPKSARTLPLDSLSAIVAELPPGVVPLDQRTPGAVKEPAMDTLSASDISVARQLNIAPETFNKQK